MFLWLDQVEQVSLSLGQDLGKSAHVFIIQIRWDCAPASGGWLDFSWLGYFPLS